MQTARREGQQKIRKCQVRGIPSPVQEELVRRPVQTKNNSRQDENTGKPSEHRQRLIGVFHSHDIVIALSVDKLAIGINANKTRLRLGDQTDRLLTGL